MSVCDNCATGSSSAGVTSANIVDAVVWAVPGRLRSRLARSDGGRGRLVRAGWRRASPHGKYKSSAKKEFQLSPHRWCAPTTHTHTLEPHLPWHTPRERREHSREKRGTGNTTKRPGSRAAASLRYGEPSSRRLLTARSAVEIFWWPGLQWGCGRQRPRQQGQDHQQHADTTSSTAANANGTTASGGKRRASGSGAPEGARQRVFTRRPNLLSSLGRKEECRQAHGVRPISSVR